MDKLSLVCLKFSTTNSNERLHHVRYIRNIAGAFQDYFLGIGGYRPLIRTHSLPPRAPRRNMRTDNRAYSLRVEPEKAHIMGTVQNVRAAIPIIARDPPPEGQSGASVIFALAGGNAPTLNLFQLNSQSGLALSQVCSLCIDNTQNGGTLTVTHGAFNEVVLIPPYTFQIFPTFSTQGQYPLSINSLNACSVPVVLLNYTRAPAQFPTTHQTSIFNTGYNVWSYYSNVIKITGNGLIQLGIAGNMWIDSLDLAIDTVNTSAT